MYQFNMTISRIEFIKLSQKHAKLKNLTFTSKVPRMQYQIIPLEMGSIVTRDIFQTGNMEIKCGLVWKLGSVLTMHKPSFMKNYNPDTGICIADIKGGIISKTYHGQKVIYFSETMPEALEQELSDIFYGISQKFSGPYQDVFQDLQWKWVNSETFIFGELEVKEVNSSDNFLNLYK